MKIQFLQKSLLRIYAKIIKIVIYVLQLIQSFTKSLEISPFWKLKLALFKFLNPDSLGVKVIYRRAALIEVLKARPSRAGQILGSVLLLLG